ncbi:MAG: CFI-box-CTERM domain-containing protein [Thiobacillaceae bacterium]
MKKKPKQKKSKAVSASELAQMGVCERLVVFEHRYGKHSAASQRAAIHRGLKEHDHFYRDGVRVSEGKGRCYIATLIFGPGREATSLRMFRDRVLRPNATERWPIGMCYRTAPRVCTALERWPWLQPIARAILKPIAWVAHRAPRCNGGNHVN